MKKVIFIISVFVSGCTSMNTTNDVDTPPSLYPQPKTVKLNLEKGYSANTVTGDSILPIINRLGDTVKTGEPILAIGSVFHVDSMPVPKRYNIPPKSQLTIKNALANVHQIPENLSKIPFNQDSITRVPLNDITEINTNHFIVNSIGDTIYTGVPQTIKGKTFVGQQPKTTPALAPRFADNANINIQYLDINQGMISSSVNCMLEDKSGNLWFATNNGLSRYDGSSFLHYTAKEGLPNDYVEIILQDKVGDIWISTLGNGLCRYDGTSFTHFTAKEGFINWSIFDIIQDQKGNLWFATDGAGVIKYNGESFTFYTKNEGLKDNVVWSIVEDKSGYLWFATDSGLCKYDGSSFFQFNSNTGLNSIPIYEILEDKSEDLWLSSDEGVYRFNGTSFILYTEKEGLVSEYIMSMYEDQSGDIWFTSDKGICKYDKTSFTHYNKKQGLSNPYVYAVIEDKRGNLWFGTGGGVNKYDRRGFSHYSENEGLSDPIVWSILEDEKGDLWFSTEDGVCKYDGTHYTHYNTNEGLYNNVVVASLEDKAGNIWFAHEGGGVSKYDGNSFTHYSEKEGLGKNTVRAMLEDEKGNIWFGTFYGGVSKYDGTSFTNYTDKNGLSNNSISSMLEDKEGNIWFATQGGGISKFDGKYFTHYTEKEGLSHNRTFSIMEAKNGNLWFGTMNGLNKFDGVSFTHYTTKEGLSNKYVYSIIEDHKSNIWVSTDKGLSLIANKSVSVDDTLKKSSYRSIYRVEKNDGLMGVEFALNSAFFDSKNRMWWGSIKNLTMLDLNNFELNCEAPQMHLRQVQINGKNIDYRKVKDNQKNEIQFTDVQDFENYPLDLELAYNQNHLTFHFSGIDWAAPQKIKYSYLIDGLKGDWSVPSSETKADFRNIPYGTYTFNVVAIGESETWSEPFRYTFVVNPPWWHTWWARLLYAIATIIVVWFIVRLRTAKLEQRQIELETEVNIATTEIRHQKEVVENEKEKSDTLLLNILPHEVAEELKEKGTAEAKHYDEVSVLFTDFVGFTSVSSKLTAKELVDEIHTYFSAFDGIIEEHGLEKIKTIGDAYMAVCGLPQEIEDHAERVVQAALDINDYVTRCKGKFGIRIGVNSGPVVAGIVGLKKYAYDIWGDTVNTAARMESSGQAGKVNISQTTYDLLKEDSEFTFESRGKIEAKGKGEIEMFFVTNK